MFSLKICIKKLSFNIFVVPIKKIKIRLLFPFNQLFYFFLTFFVQNLIQSFSIEFYTIF